MKFLHTSDWHVGKTLKGRNRLEEQKAVLAQIVDVAADHDVDAVLVAGDLYENAVPTADAVTLVNRTLRTIARHGIEVVVIAGNHDHPGTFEAYRPVMRDARIHVYGAFRTGTGGGCTGSRPAPPGSRWPWRCCRSCRSGMRSVRRR